LAAIEVNAILLNVHSKLRLVIMKISCQKLQEISRYEHQKGDIHKQVQNIKECNINCFNPELKVN